MATEILYARPRYHEDVDPAHVDGARAQAKAAALLRTMPEVERADIATGCAANVVVTLRDGRTILLHACTSRRSMATGKKRGSRGYYLDRGITPVAVDNSDARLMERFRQIFASTKEQRREER